MSKATHNGTCQVCGRVHAVNPRTAGLAKHGYTTRWGFFSGTCQGAGHMPLENSRELADKIIAQLQQYAADQQAIADGETAVTHFSFEYTVRGAGMGKYAQKEFASLTRDEFETIKADKAHQLHRELNMRAYSWGDAVKKVRNSAGYHARNATAEAGRIVAAIAERHGQPLIPREAA